MENKEILFENSHTRDKATLKEVYKYEYFGKPIWIAVFVLLLFDLILLTGLSIWEYVATGYWFMNYSIIVLLLIVPLITYLLYSSTVKTALKRDIEMFGKPLSGITKVTEESILTESDVGAVTETGFDKIKGGAQTKNFIILRTKANMLFIFRKDGFSVGTKEDFVTFLKNKGIKVRGK